MIDVRRAALDRFAGFEDHYHSVARFAYLVTGDLGAAEDLTQEAFLRAAERGVDLRAPGARSYLRTVVVNLWKRHARRLSTELKALIRADRPTFGGFQGEIDDRDLVWRALRRLPHQPRACLVLRYYEDLSLEQVAKELEMPLGTVKSHISRGLRRIARTLGEQT